MASTYDKGQAAPRPSLRDPDPGDSRRPRRRLRASGDEDDRVRDGAAIASLIEGEILPRLIGTDTSRRASTAAGFAPGSITTTDVMAFAPLAFEVEADELLAFVEQVRLRGHSVEDLCCDLLAPAARVIGEWWVDDRASFFDVTMALWRLQEVVHELSARVPPPLVGGAPRRRALFAPMPGDQHGFGTLLLEEVFVRAGWITDRLSDPRALDLADRVAADWFDLAGLTVSCDSHIGALPAVIATIRAASRNPRLRVMVGGPALLRDPSIATRVGADGTARDARLAVTVASRLVDDAVAGSGPRHDGH